METWYFGKHSGM